MITTGRHGAAQFAEKIRESNEVDKPVHVVPLHGKSITGHVALLGFPNQRTARRPSANRLDDAGRPQPVVVLAHGNRGESHLRATPVVQGVQAGPSDCRQGNPKSRPYARLGCAIMGGNMASARRTSIALDR